MKHSQANAIKKAPGSCKLKVIETPTRDCICAGTDRDTTTIAYVAIGAESWGPLLAAAPDMLDALQAMFDARGRDTEKVVQMCKDAISKATGVPHA